MWKENWNAFSQLKHFQSARELDDPSENKE